MYVHQPAEDFDPEQCFDDVPLHQSIFYRTWKQTDGHRVIALADSDESGAVRAYVQCVEHTLPMVGSVWIADRGPLGTFDTPAIEAEFYRELRRLCAGEAPASHLRLQRVPPNDLIRSFPSEQVPGSFTQPIAERIISLDGDLEHITASFSASTRRQIRSYERDKNGIRLQVERVDFMSRFSDVYDIFLRTSEEKKFSLHDRSHYEALFSELVKTPERGALILGYIDSVSKKPVSAVLVVYTGSEAYHLFVGNLPEGYDRDMPTITLYAALREAKEQGLRRYNLGGVAGGASSSLDALSIFKKKFGGDVVHYDRQRDIVISFWRYGLFRFLRLPVVIDIRRLLIRWYRSAVVEVRSADMGE